MWPKLDDEFLKPFPKQGGDSVLLPDNTTEAEAWKECIDKILEFREYGDDWDGQGAEAIAPEVADSAMILAILLRERKVRPPTWTVPGFCGEVSFDWQWHDQTTLTLDVAKPYEANLVLLPTGGEGRRWVIRQPVSV